MGGKKIKKICLKTFYKNVNPFFVGEFLTWLEFNKVSFVSLPEEDPGCKYFDIWLFSFLNFDLILFQ